MTKIEKYVIVGFNLVSLGLLMGEIKNLFDVIQTAIILVGVTAIIHAVALRHEA